MAAARLSRAPIRGTPAVEKNREIALEAIEDRYISVTPLHLDLTHDASLAALRAAYSSAD